MPGLRVPANSLLPAQGGNATGTVVPDLALGTFYFYALTGNTTISNPINAPGPGSEFVISLTQDATGSRTVAWVGFFGPIPAVTATAMHTSIYRFVNVSSTGQPVWWCVGFNTV